MGVTVLTPSSSFEETITSAIPPYNTQGPVTHIICNSSDFAVAKKSVSDSAFCCFVTPKWVFISQSLHYSLPVVR